MTAPSPQVPAVPSDERKSILFVNLYAEMGGGEYALYYTLRAFDRSRIRPVLLFNRDGEFPARARRLGLETIIDPFPAVTLKRLLAPATFAAMVGASVRMHRLLRVRRIDIVQCADLLTLLLVAFPAMLRRLPVVYCMLFFDAWVRLLLFNCLAVLLVDRIVTPSAALASSLERQTVMLGSAIETIAPGVDTEIFHPRGAGEGDSFRVELGVPEGQRLVAMVARFDAAKGHRVFLQAAKELLVRGEKALFVVVGDAIHADVLPSERHWRNAIFDLHRELALGDAVRFLGHRADVPEILRAVDVLVIPSAREGFGMVALEALASGTPVVASPSIGAWESIRGRAGVYCARGADAVSFASAITRALGETSRGGASRMELADGLRSWDTTAAGFALVYDRVQGSSIHFPSQRSRIQ